MLINVKIEILFVLNLESITDEFKVFQLFVDATSHNYTNKIETNFKSLELSYAIR